MENILCPLAYYNLSFSDPAFLKSSKEEKDIDLFFSFWILKKLFFCLLEIITKPFKKFKSNQF